jgi:TRAP-type mannitol/chloroaromatic compound transport system substrate-binding protein
MKSDGDKAYQAKVDALPEGQKKIASKAMVHATMTLLSIAMGRGGETLADLASDQSLELAKLHQELVDKAVAEAVAKYIADEALRKAQDAARNVNVYDALGNTNTSAGQQPTTH